VAEERMPGPGDALFFQYRLFMRDLLGRRCNFVPSCSHFGQLAMEEHGPLMGTMMALERWSRCHSSALGYGYYMHCAGDWRLSDPLEVDEGNLKWDSLLLPF
jgi:putative component of membrane protein insertase Oxa1/YidC/SpoIIIJ protein YidD